MWNLLDVVDMEADLEVEEKGRDSFIVELNAPGDQSELKF
jgi:hypothetical protein